MPGLIKISDLSERGALAFDIRNLLELVREEGEKLDWTMFPTDEGTDITCDLSSFGMIYGELLSRIDESGAGMSVSWDELTALAACIHQTIWGTYIGSKNAANNSIWSKSVEDVGLSLDSAPQQFYELTEIAFQAIDSSFWLVYARDWQVLQRIQNAFRDTISLKIW
jgi:hypothetical protein